MEVTVTLGEQKYVVPSRALESSDVFHAMITSPMKEGETRCINLTEEDSAFALSLYLRLAMLWVIDPNLHQGLLRLEPLNEQALHEVLSFFNKYQVTGHFYEVIIMITESIYSQRCDVKPTWKKLILLDKYCPRWRPNNAVCDWVTSADDDEDVLFDTYIERFSSSTRSHFLQYSLNASIEYLNELVKMRKKRKIC
jgi:hypothetical protein